MSVYEGVVVFREGVHYAVDDEGNPDTDRPLRWESDGYRDAVDGEPLHNDANHGVDLELEIGGEE